MQQRSRLTLYPFQQEDVDKLVDVRNVLIGNEMGWWKYILITESCWLWLGALGGAGRYGTYTEYISKNCTKQYVAHRLVYETLRGPLAEDMHLHHVCGIKSCVNPYHLNPLSAVEHGRAHWKGQCKNGHAFTEENIYINTRNQRECKECRREAGRRYNARNRRKETI